MKNCFAYNFSTVKNEISLFLCWQRLGTTLYYNYLIKPIHFVLIWIYFHLKDLDCKLNWSPKFYKNVLSVVGLKKSGAFY